MFDISSEFEELLDLCSSLGFKGEDVERCAAELLHALNEAVRCYLDGRSKM